MIEAYYFTRVFFSVLFTVFLIFFGVVAVSRTLKKK